MNEQEETQPVYTLISVVLFAVVACIMIIDFAARQNNIESRPSAKGVVESGAIPVARADDSLVEREVYVVEHYITMDQSVRCLWVSTPDKVYQLEEDLFVKLIEGYSYKVLVRPANLLHYDIIVRIIHEPGE